MTKWRNTSILNSRIENSIQKIPCQFRSIQLFCNEMAEAINEGKALANGGSTTDVEEEMTAAVEAEETATEEA